MTSTVIRRWQVSAVAVSVAIGVGEHAIAFVGPNQTLHHPDDWPALVSAARRAESMALGLESTWRVSRTVGESAEPEVVFLRVVSAPALPTITMYSMDPADPSAPEAVGLWAWDCGAGLSIAIDSEGEVVVRERLPGPPIAQDMATVARLSDPTHPHRWWSGVGRAAVLESTEVVGDPDRRGEGVVSVPCNGPLASDSAAQGTAAQRVFLGSDGFRGYELVGEEPPSKSEPYLVRVVLEIEATTERCPLPPSALRVGEVFVPDGTGPGISRSVTRYELLSWRPVEDANGYARSMLDAMSGDGMSVFDARAGVGYVCGSPLAQIDGVDYEIAPASGIEIDPRHLLDRCLGAGSSGVTVSMRAISDPGWARVGEPLGPVDDGREQPVADLYWALLRVGMVLAVGACMLFAWRRIVREPTQSPCARRTWPSNGALLAVAALMIPLGAMAALFFQDEKLNTDLVLDLGRVQAGPGGAEVSRSISWTNTSGGPLQIRGLSTDCGCLSVYPSAREIAPGAAVELAFTMVLARAETRTVGAHLLLSTGEVLHWDVRATAEGALPVRLLPGDRILEPGHEERLDLLICGDRAVPPQITIVAPAGFSIAMQRARVLGAKQADPADSDRVADAASTTRAHWHVVVMVVMDEDGVPHGASIARPLKIKGALQDGRIFEDVFIVDSAGRDSRGDRPRDGATGAS